VSGSRRRSAWPLALLASVACVAAVLVAAIMALFGASVSCLGGATASAAGPTPTGAVREIPASRLHIYMGAARRLDISWPFLASIGVQECGADGHCGLASSGCAGVMEIAYVRGSECSPDPSVPTIWERFEVDADGGGADIFDPADAIFTAARILRKEMGAPPAGGSYHGYYEAACHYYGACADGIVDYAHEVMARAVEFGFGHEGAAGSSADGEAIDPVDLRHERRAGPDRADEAVPIAQGAACVGSLAGGGAPTVTGSAIVRIARSQLGEGENPPGSNCTKYGPCEEWCGFFVAWVWEHAGVAMAGGTGPYGYSGRFFYWVKEHGGRDLPPTTTPSPGDAVMYGSGPRGGESEHVGIVELVLAGEIVTIEGNYLDQVSRVGPFFPATAEVEGGEAGPIYGYAEPPGLSGPGAGVDHG
jgi:hypothetical protein